LKRDKRRYSDRREYLIAAVRKRSKRIRQMAIEYKGGRCQLCGYDRCAEAMEFHHLDSSGKDFGISERGYTRGWKRVKEELDKCIMLCANCHREVRAGLQLSREIVIEKSGEFREIRHSHEKLADNPEPSHLFQTDGRCRDYPEMEYSIPVFQVTGKSPTSSSGKFGKDEEIVQALK